jgi:hypothetical protein
MDFTEKNEKNIIISSQQKNSFLNFAKPLSPPNEFENTGVHRAQHQHQSNFLPNYEITDDMIQKFQKMDSVLNFGIERVNSEFISYLLIKYLLEFFFTRYSDSASNQIHTISKDNLDYILSLCDEFDFEDINTIYEIGTYDNIYVKAPDDGLSFANLIASETDSGIALPTRGNPLPKISEISDPEQKRKVEVLENKLTKLEKNLAKVADLFIQFLHKRITIGEGGVKFEESAAKLNEGMLQSLISGKSLIRKLIKVFKDNFLSVSTEEKIRELFATDIR